MGKPLPTSEIEEPERVIPDRLLTCYVEDWCDPGSDPIPSWRGDIRRGTNEWVWHWQLAARQRQRRARETYRRENGITEPWPLQGRPRWQKEST
jgi:hypothetical protein